MLVKRKDAVKIAKAAQGNLKDKAFNLQTQYKILRLVKAIEEEDELMQQSVLKVAEQYAQRDENGQIIINEDGGFSLDRNRMEEITNELNNINNAEIQIPDIYFSLDEFEGLGLTLEELDAFMAFIK